MPNYIDSVEKAHNEGRGFVYAEEAVGLRGGDGRKEKDTLSRKKKDTLKRLSRLLKMAFLENRYKPERQPQRQASEVLPSSAEITEYRRLGGSDTAEGREYRRKWMGNK